jgi:hypothetical protein
MIDGIATATWRRIGNNWVAVICNEDAACVEVGMIVRIVSKSGRTTMARLVERFRSGPGWRDKTYRAIPLGASGSPRAANTPPPPARSAT